MVLVHTITRSRYFQKGEKNERRGEREPRKTLLARFVDLFVLHSRTSLGEDVKEKMIFLGRFSLGSL